MTNQRRTRGKMKRIAKEKIVKVGQVKIAKMMVKMKGRMGPSVNSLGTFITTGSTN